MKGLALSPSSSSSFVNGGSDAMATSSSGRSSAVVVPYTLTIEAAHKKGAGSTKNGRDSNPKMLGVKIYGDQPAQPGAIIIRQHGTKFHPGKNVGLGRDYTIYSLIDGLVKFEKYGPDRKKVSVYPILEEKVENPNSRRVKRREAFREQREKKKAYQLATFFGDAGVQLVGQLASVPEGDEESDATVLA
jgi:large subunit ribosomal protein L27